MRPYRGIPIGGKEFVYGWYVEKEDSHSNTYSVIVFGRDFEVIPETVGQQVGLKERYGEHREVWQGDIVKWSPVDYDWDDYCSDDLNEEEIGTIVWFQPAGRWAIEVRGKTYWPKEIDFFDVEIIGDIHTTPELLEQDNA